MRREVISAVLGHDSPPGHRAPAHTQQEKNKKRKKKTLAQEEVAKSSEELNDRKMH